MCNGDYMLHFFPYFLHLSGVIESYLAGKLPLNGCICDYAWSCPEMIMLCFFPNFLRLSGVTDSYSDGKLPLNGYICDYAWSCPEMIMNV